MRKTKMLVAAAALAVAAVSLSGCSASAPAQPKVKSLTLWEAQSTPKQVVQVVNDYEKASGVKINILTIPDTFETNVLTKWNAGQRPDIIFWQPSTGELKLLNPKKNLQDLGALPFVKKTKFGLANSGEVGGVHYTASYGFPAVFGIFYSKAVFAKDGLTPPTTPAEFNSDAAKITADGTPAISLSLGDSWTGQLPFIEASTDLVKAGAIADIISGKGKYTESKWLPPISIMHTWVQNGWVNPDYKTALYANQPAALQSGQVGMVVQASWMDSSYTDPSKVGFIPWPSKSGASQYQSSNNASVQLPITGSSAREAASKAFVNYLTVGAGYKKLLGLLKQPSIIDGIPNPKVNALDAAAAKAFSNGIPSVDQAGAPNIPDRLTLLAAVAYGATTPADAAQKFQVETETTLQTAG